MYKLFAYVALCLAALVPHATADTVHRVRKGDTLTDIAKAYGVAPEAIEAANHLSNADQLRIGQELRIPGVNPVAGGLSYTIQRGDNLTDIAKKFGVSVEALKQANRLTNANRLSVGQTLVIPGTAAAAPSSAAGSVYVVQRGDSLSDIAKKHGLDVDQLKAANQLANPNQLDVGQRLVIPGPGAAGAAAPVTYVEYRIRRGDSLSDIAKKYGVSLQQLAALNGIRNANRIKIGQAIRIPSNGAPIPSGPSLDPDLLKTLDRVRLKSGQWKHIVIHHSGSRSGSAKAFDRFHREERRMENGLAYHFVIGNGRGMGDGELHVGDRWKKQIQGGHLSSYALNQISIGICLVGDFQKTRPSRQQMEQLEALVRYLMAETGVPESRVTTHTLIHPKHTLCPGKFFPIDTFRKNIARP